jgi:phage FluMu protein Com
MDLTFSCEHCKQQLAVDTSAAGTEIECPSCGRELTVPQPDPTNIHLANPINASAAAKEDRHFSVPVHDHPTEMLIEKPLPTLEVAARDEDKLMKIRCIKRTDCIEVGKDRFEEVVSGFLSKIGQQYIIGIHPINYSHIDMGSRQILVDFGVMIVYRG